MPTFEPFQALRPQSKYAETFSSLPYDVFNRAEGRVEVRRRPLSFLRIDKAEVTLPDLIDEHDMRVYQQAALHFKDARDSQILKLDEDECYYLYRLRDGEHVQTGFVGCVSVSDYDDGFIRKHEFTRPDKERDRVRQINALEAHTGPILLAHQPDDELNRIIAEQSTNVPLYQFTTEDGIEHTIFKITNRSDMLTIGSQFARHDALYIADGHHRAEAASKVAKLHPDNEEAQLFLAVSFSSDQLKIMGYHRAVEDLYGQSVDELLERISQRFTVTVGRAETTQKHRFEMYLKQQWYTLDYTAQQTTVKDNLDVSILQHELLTPFLGIEDPRTDARIQFVGGIRGYAGLEQLVDHGTMAVAFHLHPTDLTDLMQVADANQVMPPKSTWFEPKLRSGLLIHRFFS